MLAVTQLELGLIEDISATLGDFEGKDESNSQFISSLSYKLLELGATAEAKQLLVQSEQNSPESASNNARQGILKLMMNDLSGIANLEDAVKLDPEFIEAELALAFAELQSGNLAKAKGIAEKWQEKYPDKADSYNLIASIAIKEQKYEQAEKALAQSLALDPDNLFALTEQLRIARKQQNDVLSKQRVDHLMNLAPHNNRVLRHYFGVYRNEMALAKLTAAYKADEKNIGKAILLSEALLNLGKLKEAESILLSKADMEKLPKRYWQLLVLVYKNQNELENIQSTLEAWLKGNPYHIEAVILLTDFYAGQRNFERALSVVKRGLVNHKENLLLQLIQMHLLLNSKQIMPAKNLYKVLAVKNIHAALKEGMLGRIYLLEESYAKAVEKLEILYKAYPSNQNAIYLAGGHLGNKDNLKAVKVLEDFLIVEPNDSRVKTMLAGIYLEDDSNQAITVYVDLVKKQPKNVVAHNNLAWLYLEKNNVDKALIHAQKAFELAPHIANIVDTYGKVLLGSGDKKSALKYASKASEIAKGQDVDIQLNYIEALIANDLAKEAKVLLAKVTTVTNEQKNKKAELLVQL
jgi:putative PEP-CTERM system TPR-repeat lipoprotein